MGESPLTIRRAISRAEIEGKDGKFPLTPVFRAVFEMHNAALWTAVKKANDSMITR